MASRPAHPRYRSAFSSCATSRASSASLSDDEDAITPAGPIVAAAAAVEETRNSSSKAIRRKRRAVSPADSNPDVPSFSLDDGAGFCYLNGPDAASASDPLAAGMDSLSLWRRMLAVQRVFGCYNSARISAALDDEALQSRVPSRACLDLLNDSIAHLPDDEREQVEYFIEHGEMKPSRKRRSLWRSLA
ncbi:hypothetical protein GGTG_13949 [Gaeumannomyces tritici R3-111a-1]|uniref:Uncharacterized protein n=1 Tax=Gaeumannomyces tritici (strain R3-111a-1) TaxID=644352 RepID=J3PK99_GAET3|nr:hypothetical protein GGTG_13949 [Gaeumannomyces tritici R3-111a-1]EJT68473.1 hypothetical protein GGTG_13949 [Gaeumannomyces tritici R3-111a-1]